jgi:hypothetical protein
MGVLAYQRQVAGHLPVHSVNSVHSVHLFSLSP